MNNKTFSTADFCLSASLVSLGINPIDIEKNPSNQKQFLFIFNLDDQCQDYIDLFWIKHLKVTPQDFHNSQKYLKRLIERKSNAT